MLDLLILDIDDIFIPHRTVDAGYRLFLKSLSQLYNKKVENETYYTTSNAWIAGLKIMTTGLPCLRHRAAVKRLVRLTVAGLHLNLLYLLREVTNRFIRMGSEKIIRAWVKVVLNSNVEKDRLYPETNLIKRNLNTRLLTIYEQIRKDNPRMKVIAISQNFMIDKDPLKEILDIDEIHSNEFFYDTKGLITGYELRVKNGHDKKKIAERLVKKYKAKKIGVIVDDYDDLELLRLKKIEFVICNQKIRRFIRNKSVERIQSL